VRVLHVTDRLSARGGADWHLLGVLAEQVRDCDVHLVVGRDDGTATAPCPVTVAPALAGGEADVQVGAALDRIAASFCPDVIHLHNCLHPGVLAWAAERGALMTVQDHRVFCPGSGKLTLERAVCRQPMGRATCAPCFTEDGYFERIYATTQRRLNALRRMFSLIVLSDYMKVELVVAGVDAARIAVIPPFVHGFDVDAPPGGPPCILFVGRLVEAKGIFDALEAYRRSGLELPLVFAGTGSERERLEAAGCEVLGWIPHAQLAAVYKRARALLMPSRWQEPFGIVGLEALTMGVPVVAWDSGGVREWLAAVTPWGDIEALAHALRRAIGTRAQPPEGFARAQLMARLRLLYEHRLQAAPPLHTL
jgi:glycosyltransferase involved in cell wall biosynthesis